jgi:hypothetical protein
MANPASSAPGSTIDVATPSASPVAAPEIDTGRCDTCGRAALCRAAGALPASLSHTWLAPFEGRDRMPGVPHARATLGSRKLIGDATARSQRCRATLPVTSEFVILNRARRGRSPCRRRRATRPERPPGFDRSPGEFLLPVDRLRCTPNSVYLLKPGGDLASLAGIRDAIPFGVIPSRKIRNTCGHSVIACWSTEIFHEHDVAAALVLLGIQDPPAIGGHSNPSLVRDRFPV